MDKKKISQVLNENNDLDISIKKENIVKLLENELETKKNEISELFDKIKKEID